MYTGRWAASVVYLSNTRSTRYAVVFAVDSHSFVVEVLSACVASLCFNYFTFCIVELHVSRYW